MVYRHKFQAQIAVRKPVMAADGVGKLVKEEGAETVGFAFGNCG